MVEAVSWLSVGRWCVGQAAFYGWDLLGGLGGIVRTMRYFLEIILLIFSETKIVKDSRCTNTPSCPYFSIPSSPGLLLTANTQSFTQDPTSPAFILTYLSIPRKKEKKSSPPKFPSLPPSPSTCSLPPSYLLYLYLPINIPHQKKTKT